MRFKICVAGDALRILGNLICILRFYQTGMGTSLQRLTYKTPCVHGVSGISQIAFARLQLAMVCTQC